MEFRNPKDGLTTADVQNVMNTIISKNIIQMKNEATFTSVKNAVGLLRKLTQI